jgi:hypothetical protein
MPPILWRIVAAILIVWAVFQLLGPVTRLIGLPLSADVFTVVRVITAVGAAWFILFGTSWPAWTRRP